MAQDFCKCIKEEKLSFVTKILFHPTRINSPWQLNELDHLSNCGSCLQVILIELPHFQFASYRPVVSTSKSKHIPF